MTKLNRMKRLSESIRIITECEKRQAAAESKAYAESLAQEIADGVNKYYDAKHEQSNVINVERTCLAESETKGKTETNAEARTITHNDVISERLRVFTLERSDLAESNARNFKRACLAEAEAGRLREQLADIKRTNAIADESLNAANVECGRLLTENERLRERVRELTLSNAGFIKTAERIDDLLYEVLDDHDCALSTRKLIEERTDVRG